MTAVLQLREVSKVYGEGPTKVHALREVDLSVQSGELVAVMGPIGSGKSTLLTIAGSLEEPTSGEVLVAGSELSSMTRNQRAGLRRRAIGYVFQDFNLLAGLTAVENAALPLELDGVSAKAARPVGLAALQELGQTSSRLVSIDLISGRATDRGRVGELLTGLAIELGPQCDANNSDRGDNDDSDR